MPTEKTGQGKKTGKGAARILCGLDLQNVRPVCADADHPPTGRDRRTGRPAVGFLPGRC
jgi:hypothetical protein